MSCILNNINAFFIYTPFSNLISDMCFVFIYVYHSWYPCLVLVWILLFYFDRDKCINFIVTGILSIIIGNIIFLAYPTTVLRPDIVVNDFTSLVVSITYNADIPVNCMPSMHCIFCFISIFCLFNSKIKLTICQGFKTSRRC